MQLRIIGIDTAAFAHGHVVRWIEAAGTNVAPSAGKASLPANGVLTAQRVTVVLHQPQTVLVAEHLDLRQVEGVAQRVCHHNSLGLFAQCGFQLGDIDVILRDGYVHEHRYCTILQGRRDCRGKAAGHGDDLVAALDLPVTQFRCRQS